MFDLYQTEFQIEMVLTGVTIFILINQLLLCVYLHRHRYFITLRCVADHV